MSHTAIRTVWVEVGDYDPAPVRRGLQHHAHPGARRSHARNEPPTPRTGPKMLSGPPPGMPKNAFASERLVAI